MIKGWIGLAMFVIGIITLLMKLWFIGGIITGASIYFIITGFRK